MHICILTHQEAVEGGIALSGKGLVCHISGFQCDRQGWGRSNLLLLLDLRGRGSVRCTLVATSRNVSKPFLPREVLQIVLDVIESQPQNLWNAEGGDGGESHDTGAEADCRGEPSVRRQVAKGKGGEERAARTRVGKTSMGTRKVMLLGPPCRKTDETTKMAMRPPVLADFSTPAQIAYRTAQMKQPPMRHMRRPKQAVSMIVCARP
jgi:hypothetical protein